MQPRFDGQANENEAGSTGVSTPDPTVVVEAVVEALVVVAVVVVVVVVVGVSDLHRAVVVLGLVLRFQVGLSQQAAQCRAPSN